MTRWSCGVHGFQNVRCCGEARRRVATDLSRSYCTPQDLVALGIERIRRLSEAEMVAAIDAVVAELRGPEPDPFVTEAVVLLACRILRDRRSPRDREPPHPVGCRCDICIAHGSR